MYYKRLEKKKNISKEDKAQIKTFEELKRRYDLDNTEITNFLEDFLNVIEEKMYTKILECSEIVGENANITYNNQNILTAVDIIDALTSSDATKVLSAKQGKVLGDRAYISDKGSNSNGNYVKWSNGLMICYKTISKSVACNNQWSALYESTSAVNFGNWAESFKETPFAQVTGGGSGSWLQTLSGTSKTAVGSGHIASATSWTRTLIFNCLGIGSWK